MIKRIFLQEFDREMDDILWHNRALCVASRGKSELTMASSPMPLPMFSSSGMMLNLPAVPETLIIKRMPNALMRSRYIVPSRSYVDAYLQLHQR